MTVRGPAGLVETFVDEATLKDGESTVYNLDVEGLHDYFAGGVLVHNKP
jgi:intein/homing endonuclease